MLLLPAMKTHNVCSRICACHVHFSFGRLRLKALFSDVWVFVVIVPYVRLQPRWRLCSCRNQWSSPAYHLPAAYHFARGPSFTRALFVRGWVRDAPALISSIREP